MSFDALLQKALSMANDGINVAEMAIVTAVTDNERIDCQPLVMKWFENGDTENLPIICDVPLIFGGSGNAKIELEISVSDYVLLIISDKDISTLKNGWPTKPIEPDSLRMHDLSDAVAIPISTSSAGTGHIYINSAGKMSFTNGGVELLAQIDALLDALITMGGGLVPPQLPFGVAVTAVKTALASLKI